MIQSGVDDILIISGRNKRAIEDHFDRCFELEAKFKNGTPLSYETLLHAHQHLLVYKKDIALSRPGLDKAGPNYNLQSQNQTPTTKILIPFFPVFIHDVGIKTHKSMFLIPAIAID
jgi:hypothetical protein